MDREYEIAAVEAAEWLRKLNSRAVSNEELTEFYDWRRIPGNAAAYSDVERIWSDARVLTRDPDIRQAVEAALRGTPQKAPAPAAKLGRRELLAIAVVGAVALGAYGLTGRSDIYETKVGERRSIRLADGSVLELNTNSRVAVRLSSSSRDVDLEHGEALFDVAHDAERPFAVTTSNRRVIALGTRFNVRRYDERVEVVLAEGRVAVEYDEQRRLIDAGQAISVRADGEARVSEINADDATAWTSGRVVFRETPILRAIAEMNRYSHTKMELRAPNLREEELSGSFAAGDTKAFVEALISLFPLRKHEPSERLIVLSE